MNRASPFLWIAIVLFVLLPTAMGRFLLDLAGGLIIITFSLPILISGLGWIAWKVIQSRSKQCEVCGTSFMGEQSKCPLCGGALIDKKNEANSSEHQNNSIPASAATIDIKAEESD